MRRRDIIGVSKAQTITDDHYPVLEEKAVQVLGAVGMGHLSILYKKFTLFLQNLSLLSVEACMMGG